MKEERPLQSIPDNDLLDRLSHLVGQSRRLESELVAHIAEVDERRLYAQKAFPSMFAYCTEVLHLSGAEAYLRITAARLSRKYPAVLTMLADGRLHLSGIAILAPHLTVENAETLQQAKHKSKRQIEELVAVLPPKDDVPTVIRRLPERGRIDVSVQAQQAPAAHAHALWEHPTLALPLGPEPGPTVDPGHDSGFPARQLRPDGVGSSSPTVPAPPAVVQPLAPARYKVQFTANASLHAKLSRLQALMPDDDLATIIEKAITEKLERIEARRFGKTARPRTTVAQTDVSPSSRHIPAAVRRVVHERDQNQCRYVDRGGKRCYQRDRLEFHHRHPFGLGGDHDPANVQLLCHRHNQHLAEIDYGTKTMARHLRTDDRVSEVRPPGDSQRALFGYQPLAISS